MNTDQVQPSWTSDDGSSERDLLALAARLAGAGIARAESLPRRPIERNQ